MMKGYCESCNDTVEYYVRMTDKEANIKGKSIQYLGKSAFCDECKEEIFIPEIRDYNLKKIDSAYREAENLISVMEIERILEKYDIGKRPLSLLLGWGEGTLSRYIDGDTPSKPYSQILRRINEDILYYRKILEDNSNNITSVAYRKSIVAIEKISSSFDDIESKIESAVKYLLIKTSEITPLALQKLLYFAQGFQKAFTNEYFFDEDCEAWVHGPVYRKVYDKYKEYGYYPIEENDLNPESINLSEMEKELLDQIALCFGCYSGKVLEQMTHFEEPWRITRHGLGDWERCYRLIDKNDMAGYFNSVKTKYQMLGIIDIKEYSEDLFRKLS